MSRSVLTLDGLAKYMDNEIHKAFPGSEVETKFDPDIHSHVVSVDIKTNRPKREVENQLKAIVTAVSVDLKPSDHTNGVMVNFLINNHGDYVLGCFHIQKERSR